MKTVTFNVHLSGEVLPDMWATFIYKAIDGWRNAMRYSDGKSDHMLDIRSGKSDVLPDVFEWADIERPIYREVTMLSTTQVSQALGISQNVISQWRRAGMFDPCDFEITGPKTVRYNLEAVRRVAEKISASGRGRKRKTR